ncbi:methionine gamma-lyase family protein [Caldicoprobacter algeriensis]|uniref:methionine gamma-lyase family protein n=1 Tax=Caldicoprobacter algeriensis TaxID=699281 RepID=UPI00207A81E5|nr:methionine gamma-lyase family protein [Caldicoprobacter algeriensis]MCM8901158.1 methionine gamma-lyase family protein [Caldicoprobacter algeriensis]
MSLKSIQQLYNDLDIPQKVAEFVQDAHDKIKAIFERIDALREYHQARILKFMGECQVSQRHFYPSTGYGYGDEGRDTLDRLYAAVFGGQDALVRPQWASGTHVISDCLFALTRPGDIILSITGKPYDTLEQVIGLGKQPSDGSLAEWGVGYKQVDLTPGGNIDMPAVLSLLENQKIKLVLIQRSRGYSLRPSLSVQHIKKAIQDIKSKRSDVFVVVDNCYGEFTEELEPCHVGADMAVGSLIKNPGGGLAPTGGYAVGTSKAIEKLSYRLTCPGVGREVGSYAAPYTPFYQGLFLAPHVVGEALKGAVLTAKVFQQLGYVASPSWDEPRFDIIQSIRLRSAEELIAFCQAIQSASPVDSHVLPYPWDMPGYQHQVIMAAGTFVQGASIELSADAPLVPPYVVYLQGGLTYEHVKLALMKVLAQMCHKGFISLT